MNTDNNQQTNIDEISLIDVINFFKEYSTWILRGIGLSVFISLAFGFIYINFFGNYKAELLLINRDFNITAWKNLKNNIPVLASELDTSYKTDQFKTFESNKYWEKNLKLNFSVEKSDIKDLVNVSIPGADSVTSVDLTYNDHKDKFAVKQLNLASSLLKYGGEFFEAKLLLQSYQQQVINQIAQISRDKEVQRQQLEYLKSKELSLEKLKKAFPSNNSFSNNQVIDPKDSGAKFLPINTQLIANISDIDSVNLSQKKLDDNFNRLKFYQSFLITSSSSLKPDLNLASPIEILKKNLNDVKHNFPDNLNSNIAYNEILSDLTSIASKYRYGLQESFIKVDLHPIFSFMLNLVKFIYVKENGLEEAIYRGTDYWVFEGSRSWHSCKRAMPSTWF